MNVEGIEPADAGTGSIKVREARSLRRAPPLSALRANSDPYRPGTKRLGRVVLVLVALVRIVHVSGLAVVLMLVTLVLIVHVPRVATTFVVVVLVVVTLVGIVDVAGTAVVLVLVALMNVVCHRELLLLDAFGYTPSVEGQTRVHINRSKGPGTTPQKRAHASPEAG